MEILLFTRGCKIIILAFVPNIGILEPNPHIIDTSANALHLRDTVKVVIIEQPASKSLRWRYESEGRTAGSLCGVTSTSSNKTYPTIEVVGWQGKAQVVVSCVTVNDFK